MSTSASADPFGGAILGGALGAAVGHNISGRDGALVGGALGAIAGANIGASSGYYDRGYVGATYAYGEPVAYPATTYYAPAATYYEPSPVYYAPAPVYYAPAPVYYAPRTVVYRSPPAHYVRHYAPYGRVAYHSGPRHHRY